MTSLTAVYLIVAGTLALAVSIIALAWIVERNDTP